MIMRRLALVILLILAENHVVGLAEPTTCQDHPLIVYKIATMEGFYATRGVPVTHNNPGSLVFVGQPGAKLGKLGFARWETRQEGLEALDRDLRLKKFNKKAMRRAWTWLK